MLPNPRYFIPAVALMTLLIASLAASLARGEEVNLAGIAQLTVSPPLTGAGGGEMIETKSKKDIYGRDFEYLPAGLVKGRNILQEAGFSQCENPLYYKKDDIYFHYNKISKVWFSEKEA